MALLPFPNIENVSKTFQFDRYMDMIGEGSFASVYKARRVNPAPGDVVDVALKIVSKSRLDDRSLRDVIKEVEIAKKVRHPNCVRLLEVVQTPAEVLLVQELVDGVELFEHIRCAPRGRLPEPEVLDITRQLLHALIYLHTDRRVVHRDLKPENVMVQKLPGGGFHCVLVDFGLAKYIGTVARRKQLLCAIANRATLPAFDARMPRLSSSASVDSVESASSHASSPLLTTPCGTLKYNPPEAVRNMVLHGPEQQRTTRGDLAKRDVYSLGIIVYIMLAGQMPFTGKTKSALLEQMSCGVHFDSPRWVNISAEAKSLVAALLAHDPACRPTAAEALLDPWVAGGHCDDIDDDDEQPPLLDRAALSSAIEAVMGAEEVAFGNDVPVTDD